MTGWDQSGIIIRTENRTREARPARKLSEPLPKGVVASVSHQSGGKLSPSASMSLAPNTRLGPYEILGPLGAGGMGEVYRARDTRLERTVAIKVVPENVSRDPAALERFQRERAPRPHSTIPTSAPF